MHPVGADAPRRPRIACHDPNLRARLLHVARLGRVAAKRGANGESPQIHASRRQLTSLGDESAVLFEHLPLDRAEEALPFEEVRSPLEQGDQDFGADLGLHGAGEEAPGVENRGGEYDPPGSGRLLHCYGVPLISGPEPRLPELIDPEILVSRGRHDDAVAVRDAERLVDGMGLAYGQKLLRDGDRVGPDARNVPHQELHIAVPLVQQGIQLLRHGAGCFREPLAGDLDQRPLNRPHDKDRGTDQKETHQPEDSPGCSLVQRDAEPWSRGRLPPGRECDPACSAVCTHSHHPPHPLPLAGRHRPYIRRANARRNSKGEERAKAVNGTGVVPRANFYVPLSENRHGPPPGGLPPRTHACGTSGSRGRPALTPRRHCRSLFTFDCTMHQPEMTGQILVLTPQRG